MDGTNYKFDKYSQTANVFDKLRRQITRNCAIAGMLLVHQSRAKAKTRYFATSFCITLLCIPYLR